MSFPTDSEIEDSWDIKEGEPVYRRTNDPALADVNEVIGWVHPNPYHQDLDKARQEILEDPDWVQGSEERINSLLRDFVKLERVFTETKGHQITSMDDIEYDLQEFHLSKFPHGGGLAAGKSHIRADPRGYYK